MRISDWSSDVCSSDLQQAGIRSERLVEAKPHAALVIGVDRIVGVLDGKIRAAEQRPARCHRVPGGKADVGLGAVLSVVGDRSVTEIAVGTRSEEHTSELQSLMRISYAVFCLKKKTNETDQASIHVL